jgi:hypothetical protein
MRLRNLSLLFKAGREKIATAGRMEHEQG